METEKSNIYQSTTAGNDTKKKSNISKLSEDIKDENHNKLIVFYM